MSLFSGRNVLVTGADGFIGSHLVERLIQEGASVRAFCAYNPNGSFGWLDELTGDKVGQVDVHLGDIRDRRFVAETIRGTEIVFHLAALIAIPYSFDAPESYLETNIRGTLNVLEAVRDQADVQMIHTSTSEVYGTPDSVPIVEGHRLRAQSPYAATKVAADQMCEAYARTYGTNVVTLRPFNTYGPRQSARAVIPTILGQLLAGAREVRLGNLSPRRDLTFVEDTVEGFLAMAAAQLPPGSLVQLGTGRTVSIGELFELCCQVTGVEAEVVTDNQRARPAAAEVDILLSDPTRAGELLNWHASWPLSKGLAETARWLRPRVDVRQAARYYV